MKSIGAVKHFILAFVLALIGYAIFYQGIEYRRTRLGPWQVAFTNNAAGAPVIIINQPRLRITNVQIAFPGEAITADHPPDSSPPPRALPESPLTQHGSRITPPPPPPTTLLFSQPRSVPYNVPFGKCVFMDTTFLPGTVTFQLLGHEIELLPRVLMIDHEEHPWQSGDTVALRTGREEPGRPKH